MFRGDKDLAQRAIDHFILAPYSYGWDEEYGGLYYFLDSEGHSPTQLEWPMKLWWVHCEAMVALLMAFRSCRDASIWSQFTHLCDFTFSKVRWHMQRCMGWWWIGLPVPACSPAVHRCWPGGVVWLPHQGVEGQPEIQRRAIQRSLTSQHATFTDSAATTLPAGCFHVPRSLFLCLQLLKELAAGQQGDAW